MPETGGARRRVRERVSVRIAIRELPGSAPDGPGLCKGACRAGHEPDYTPLRNFLSGFQTLFG